RKLELGAVVKSLQDVAARGQLTASRLAPLWLTLQRNVEWWTTGPLLSSGKRVGFEGSQIVWQYYPGAGIQIQVLGTFGKVNALWSSRQTTALGQGSLGLLARAGDRAAGALARRPAAAAAGRRLPRDVARPGDLRARRPGGRARARGRRRPLRPVL